MGTEGMKIRLGGRADEPDFAMAKLKNMYPRIWEGVIEKWHRGGYHVIFLLEDGGRSVGGIYFEVCEFLNEGQGRRVIIDVRALFVEAEYRGLGLGKKLLLDTIPLAKEYFFNEHELTVAQIMIETNTQAEFYRRALSDGGEDFVELETQTPIGEKIYYFFLQ